MSTAGIRIKLIINTYFLTQNIILHCKIRQLLYPVLTLIINCSKKSFLSSKYNYITYNNILF